MNIKKEESSLKIFQDAIEDFITFNKKKGDFNKLIYKHYLNLDSITVK